jgi:RodZ C-terminal domain
VRTSTPVKSRRRRSPLFGVITAATLLAIIGSGAYLLVWHGHGGRPAAAASHSASALARPKPLSSARSAPALADVIIKVTAHQDCWVHLVDSNTGSQIYMGVIPAGTSMTWTEKQAVQLSLGNPPGIVLTANGKRQSLNASQPVTLSFSPQSSR